VTVINNVPASVRAQEGGDGELQIIIDAAVDAAESRIAAGVGSGTGKVASALKGRGVSLNGGLARRA
jgi:hypothetical protein